MKKWSIVVKTDIINLLTNSIDLLAKQEIIESVARKIFFCKLLAAIGS
jgi:hypothetical protein